MRKSTGAPPSFLCAGHDSTPLPLSLTQTRQSGSSKGRFLARKGSKEQKREEKRRKGANKWEFIDTITRKEKGREKSRPFLHHLIVIFCVIPLNLSVYGPVNEAVHALSVSLCMNFYGIFFSFGESDIYSIIIGLDVLVHGSLICF